MKIPEFTREQRRGIIVLVATALAITLFFFFSARGEAVGQVRPVGGATPVAAPSPSLVIYVDVAGRVKAPGVYQLPDGSRVIDAITIAGGTRRGVDTSHINLARKLVDGEQILVSSKKFESISPTSSRKLVFTGKVSINSGTRAQFDSLPGIGPVLAQRIIDHRGKNGPFAQVSDIQNVSGIGAAIFAQISDRLTL